MIDEDDLKTRFEREIPIYLSWGNYIRDEILRMLNDKDKDPNLFLKIPPVPRVKEVSSYLDKALRRGKDYTDPHNQITDKVGVRFVVLTEKDIEYVSALIQNWDKITFSIDRDEDKEIEKNPYLFTYKSCHIIVRNKEPIVTSNGTGTSITIPADTPCEIQIRTLLQHAWAELSHNEIYKQETDVRSEIHRKMARSVALLESTDELFQQVYDELHKEEMEYQNLLKRLEEKIGNSSDVTVYDGINRTLYFAYSKEFSSMGEDRVSDFLHFLDQKSYIIDKLNDNTAPTFYRQPMLALAYYILSMNPTSGKKYWPFSEQELQPLAVDLGVAISD